MSDDQGLREKRFELHYQLWSAGRKQLMRWSVVFVLTLTLLWLKILTPYCGEFERLVDEEVRAAAVRAELEQLMAGKPWLERATAAAGEVAKALEATPWQSRQEELIVAYQALNDSWARLRAAPRADVLVGVLTDLLGRGLVVEANAPGTPVAFEARFQGMMNRMDSLRFLDAWRRRAEAPPILKRVEDELAAARRGDGPSLRNVAIQAPPEARAALLPGERLTMAAKAIALPLDRLFMEATEPAAYRVLLEESALETARRRANQALEDTATALVRRLVGPFEAAAARAPRIMHPRLKQLKARLETGAQKMREAVVDWQSKYRVEKTSRGDLGFAATRGGKRMPGREVEEIKKTRFAPIAGLISGDLEAVRDSIRDLQQRRDALLASKSSHEAEIKRIRSSMDQLVPALIKGLFSPRDALSLFPWIVIAGVVLLGLKALSVRALYRVVQSEIEVSGLAPDDPAVSSVWNPAHSSRRTTIGALAIYGILIAVTVIVLVRGLALRNHANSLAERLPEGATSLHRNS